MAHMDVSRCGAHEFTCLVSLCFIANSQGDVGTGAGKGLSGVEADAGIGARDDGRPAGQVRQVGNGPPMSGFAGGRRSGRLHTGIEANDRWFGRLGAGVRRWCAPGYALPASRPNSSVGRASPW